MKVYIAEAVRPVRQRLTDLLREQNGMVVIAQSESVADLLSRLDRTRPDLLIMGTSLVDGSPFQALEQATKLWNEMTVIVLCEQLNGQYLFSAKKKGADYVLESPRDIDMLPTLLRQLTRGKRGYSYAERR